MQGAHWWVIAAIGLTGALGQIAPLDYAGLLWVVLLDLAIWQVLPDGITWVGAGIIVASGLYLIRRSKSGGGEA